MIENSVRIARAMPHDFVEESDWLLVRSWSMLNSPKLVFRHSEATPRSHQKKLTVDDRSAPWTGATRTGWHGPVGIRTPVRGSGGLCPILQRPARGVPHSWAKAKLDYGP